MTNEEAANVLRIMASGIELKGYSDHWISAFREAYEMAFKSLENERPQGKLIIKHHMETCENCDSVMPMMNDYYRAKLRGCPYCLTEFTNLADMRVKDELNRVKDELKEVPKERLFNPYDHRGITEI